MEKIKHYYTVEHLELECDLDYDAPDAECGFPSPDAFLFKATVGGIDVTPLLSDKLTRRIEEAAAWSTLDSRS